MAKLYLGVRIPEKTYSYMILENVDFSNSVSVLKEEISRKIDFPKEEIELIYRGNILSDNESMKEIRMEPNTSVHVFKKSKKLTPNVLNKVYSNEDCQRIADLFGTVTGAQIDVRTRARVLHKLFIAYPEFRQNLGGQAIIVDPVLFHTLNKIEVIKKIAENYCIICDAAELIVDTVKKEIVNSTEFDYAGGREDLYSSSEEEENSNSTLNIDQTSNTRRINRSELADALMLATSASLNSLSNIAQRTARYTEQDQQRNATSSSSGTSTTPVGITPSIFTNALNQALMSAANNRRTTSDQLQNLDRSESQSTDNLNSSSRLPSTERFTSELQLMKEMGLNDDNVNRQALIICNGDVEAAVNLVLSGLNNLFN